MRAKGLTKKEILAKLNKALGKDLKYSDGKILCSMCTSSLPIAKAAHQAFLDANLGDPGLFPGSVQLEKEVIASLAELLHAPKSCGGYLVSGGTEANLIALYAARNAVNLEEPEVIVPDSAHFSFEKIANMLKVKLVKAELDSSYKVNPISVKQRITKRTIAIVGSAGTAELGAVDPIEELSKIALENGLPLHVDAAFGGIMLPFLKALGHSVVKFDFQLEGVQSITVDSHKMGMSTIPAGGILLRDKKALACIETQTPYLTKMSQCTFVGTRSGASAAATWATFEILGHEGFKKIVKRCMEVTTFLYEGLEVSGFEVLLRPTMNILAFRNENPRVLADKLRKLGWYVSFVPRLNCIRVVVMPHNTKKHMIDFLNDLREIGAKVQT